MFEVLTNLQEEIERRKRELSGLDPQSVQEAPGEEQQVDTDKADSATVEQPSAAVLEDDATAKSEPAYGQTFLDILRMNEGLRQMEAAEYERNEKSRKARLAIASLTDGLAALGNLIGTTKGAFNQPQTYMVPGVSQSIDAERARDRALAERLRSSDESIRLARAKLEAADAQSRERAQQAMDLENARFEHNRELVGLRGEEARTTDAAKHENRTEEERQKQEGREIIVDKRTESQERIAAGRNATSRANTQDRIEAGREKGSRGLTDTGRAMQIQREAELAVASELAPELTRRGVRLPYGWEKNWKRYVHLAPEFYDKYYRKKGWEDIGGKVGDISGTDGKVGGFQTGVNNGNEKKGGFRK